MGLVSSVKKSVKGYFNRKEQEKKYQRELDEEARAFEREQYKVEFRKAAQEAAKLRAIKAAEQKSGLARLRAVNQLHSSPQQGGNFLQKVSEYTQANIKRREDAIKRTEALRQAAKENRDRQMALRTQVRGNTSKPFNNSVRRDKPPFY